MKKKYLYLTYHIALIAVNAILLYALLWNPYSLYFNRTEFSNIHSATRDNYSGIATALNAILILGSSYWAYRTWKRKSGVPLFVPLITLMTIFLISKAQDCRPDGYTEIIENGYYVRTESWYLDKPKKFKRWVSKDSASRYKNFRDIEWILITKMEN